MSSEKHAIPADHPALPGHFPGNPIVPGVTLLDYALRAAAGANFRVRGISAAKFTAPLRPETPFHIRFSEGRAGAVNFEVLVGESIIASGTFSTEAG